MRTKTHAADNRMIRCQNPGRARLRGCAERFSPGGGDEEPVSRPGHVFVPIAQEVLPYDRDGHLTLDGQVPVNRSLGVLGRSCLRGDFESVRGG